MADDDDEGGFGGLYEDGHWDWDDSTESLIFISDLPPQPVESVLVVTKAPTGTVEFRDDIDLIEQVRFRRRYQRKLKPGQADIISLQDVKDVAIYTAPLSFLSPVLINMLHLSTTERFIRALILCCSYYLQIADQMAYRSIECETKVRTPECEIIENEYRDNLADLRVLVAKEYSTMLIGGADTRKFHHMGPQKKRRSLSDKDARLYETLLRICVQIVWLALGRKSFNQIELEVHRMVKSEIFNAAEHTLKTGYISKMGKEERKVLLGHCVRHDKKLNTQSPLMNEVFCHREIDYRMMGLGVISYPQVTSRMRFLLLAIAGSEEDLMDNGITLGIIGLSRTTFDSMLKPLPIPAEGKSKASMSSASGYSSKSSPSAGSAGGSTRKLAVRNLYPDIILPRKESREVGKMIILKSVSRKKNKSFFLPNENVIENELRSLAKSSQVDNNMGDEEDEGFGGLYEEGHWEWNELTASLAFVSDRPPQPVDTVQVPTKVTTETVEFRDDVDLIEQLRYRRRYQRKVKTGQPEVISLQDVKDVAIYTAPISFLSPVLINMLHLSTTERFLRALVLFCAYYLQISDEMGNRSLEMDLKVRTPYSEIIEKEYFDNLADLRLLVAKEYSTMLIGGADTKKFHHMGPQKKRRSLSDKDARLFESLLRMSVQIVWLALGRKSFNQIEVEINRMFKSEIFNAVEHKLKTKYIAKMSKEERDVLLGHCLRHDRKLNTMSPLMNEVSCDRKVDFRLVGLGVIKYHQMTTRYQYMALAIAGPEEELTQQGISLGIIGMPRSTFDSMLKPLPTAAEGKSKSKASMSSQSGYSSKSSASGSAKSQMTAQKIYPDVVLPQEDSRPQPFPLSFPDEVEEILPCSEAQRRRWQKRLDRLLPSTSLRRQK